jgi:hypothetical protein
MNLTFMKLESLLFIALAIFREQKDALNDACNVPSCQRYA